MAVSYDFNAKTIIEEGRTTQLAVNEIKNWVTTTSLPELPDEFIVLFLLSCKNVIQATTNTISAYFKIKNSAPEMFNDRDIDREDLKKAVNTIHISNIPVRMNDNVAIHFYKLSDTNYQNFDFVPLTKISLMILDISQKRNPPNNLIVVMDAKGIGLMHITRLKIWAVKKFFEFLQEAMPLKIQAIHILNASYVIDKMIALAKAFIRTELMGIIKTHSPDMDKQQFYKDYVPASCLPKEYGGELPTAEELHQRTIEEFRELKPFFEAEEKLRSLYK